MTREMTLREVARITGGRLIGDPDAIITEVITDSRTVIPGALFVALRGDALLDDLSAPADVTWGAGIAASLYTSEFLRFRLAYDVADDETITHRFGLQVTAVFGSHPVEPYWVNR